VTINYPLDQKHVVRVKPSILLSDLFQLAVDQKNLDHRRYELRHPTQPGRILDVTAPLSHYNITEVTVAEKQQTPPRELPICAVLRLLALPGRPHYVLHRRLSIHLFRASDFARNRKAVGTSNLLET